MTISNVSISKRLAAGFASIGVLLAVMVGLAVTSSRSQARSTTGVGVSLDVVHQALQVKFASADVNGWQTAYAFDVAIAAKDAADDAAGSRKAFLAAAARFRSEVDALGASTLTADERTVLAGVKAGFDRFMTLDDRIVADYRSGDATRIAEAHRLVAKDEIDIFNAVAADIEKMVVQIDAGANAAVTGSADSSSNAQTTLLVGGLLALALAAVLARVITRSITAPLGELHRRLADIADGEGDLTVRLDDTRADELGQVAGAFNRFVAKMGAAVRAIADHSVVIASASEELSAVSRQMAGNADHTARRATSSSATAEQVSSSVQTVAAATEEMTVAIAEIARGASEAARVASRAGRVAEAAQDTVARLGASSTQIDQVAHLIGGIAEQTNLLALNATIEAARAGEAGKGFAVVATEVKELATRSGGATSDISRQIATIQGDVHAAVSSITDIVAVIDQINETFATIATAVEEQTATTTEISRNLVQVSAGSNEIASDVTSLARSAVEATQGANDTQRAAVELATLAAELQQLVGSFRY